MLDNYITTELDILISTQKDFFLLTWNENEFNCSESFEKLLGISKQEISELAHKHYSLIQEEKGEEICKTILEYNFENDNKSLQNDFEILSKNGKRIWFREFVTKRINDDKSSFVGFLFDITDFKEQEISLNQTIEEKEELNKSKDKLISIISHDLRSPFSSLLGFTEILINEPNLPVEERLDYLKFIYDASKVQLQMVNHLLDWTRLQSGTIEYEPQRLDILDIINNCVAVLTGSSMRKEIKINVNAETGLFVNADERLITQVVTNLLSNAVKFTPSGKEITVSANDNNNMIEIIVADEGVGIDPENQSKLFNIETKYSQIGTDGEKGTGLGLSLVKEIIEKHSGKIWFFSELNKGSEFHFTLPKSDNTVLIVEDDELNKDIYMNVVSQTFPNSNIIFCKNGFEAHNFILEKIPSILITKNNMELMSGTQLVATLRNKDLHNVSKIYVFDNEISEEEKKEYNKYQVDDFLMEDLTSQALKLLFE